MDSPPDDLRPPPTHLGLLGAMARLARPHAPGAAGCSSAESEAGADADADGGTAGGALGRSGRNGFLTVEGENLRCEAPVIGTEKML